MSLFNLVQRDARIAGQYEDACQYSWVTMSAQLRVICRYATISQSKIKFGLNDEKRSTVQQLVKVKLRLSATSAGIEGIKANR